MENNANAVITSGQSTRALRSIAARLASCGKTGARWYFIRARKVSEDYSALLPQHGVVRSATRLKDRSGRPNRTYVSIDTNE
jgi:hypothetical protein